MKSYSFSLIGKNHIIRDIPCQDFNKIAELKDGWMLAVVADGVGSAVYAKEGALVAAETVVSFVQQHFYNQSIHELKFLIQDAYYAAMNRISIMAKNAGNSIADYDTTLTCVLYDGQQIVYGHVGDGGIIGLLNTGEYVAVTEAQKGDDGYSVIPLRAGAEYWVCGSHDGPFCALLLATDGIYEGLFAPPLLRLQPQHLFIQALEEFLNIEQLQDYGKTIEEICLYQRTRLSENGSLSSLTDDDKTIAVLINDNMVPGRMNPFYYQVPDWEMLKKRQDDLLYGDEMALTAENNDNNKEICQRNEGKENIPAGVNSLYQSNTQEKNSTPRGQTRILIVGNDGVMMRNLQYTLNINNYFCDSVPIETGKAIPDQDYHFAFCIWNKYLMDRDSVRADYMLSIMKKHLHYKQIDSGLLITFGKEKTSFPFFRKMRPREHVLGDYLKKYGTYFEWYHYPEIFGKWHTKEEINILTDDDFANDDAKSLIQPYKEWAYVNDITAELLYAMQEMMKGRKPELKHSVKKYRIYSGEIRQYISMFQEYRKNKRENLNYGNLRLSEKLYKTYLNYTDLFQLNFPVKDSKKFFENITASVELMRSGKFEQIRIEQIIPGEKSKEWISEYEYITVICGDGSIWICDAFTNKTHTFYLSEKFLQGVEIPDGFRYRISNTGNKKLIAVVISGYFPFKRSML